MAHHHGKRGAFLSAFLVLAGVAALVAQGRGGGPAAAGGQTAAPQPQILKAGPGIIMGRVVEAGTSTGIAGAIVLLGSTGALGAPQLTFDDGTPSGQRSAQTDSKGQFMFRGLPVGTYAVTATATGYVRSQYGDAAVIQIRRALDLNRMIEITATDRVIDVAIEMWKNGGIGGRVVDETGDPMVGVEVTVISRMPSWGGPVMQPVLSTQTDDRGIYHADVTPGDYIVGVLAATTTVPVAEIQRFTAAQGQGNAAVSAFAAEVGANGGTMPRGVGTRVGAFSVSQFGGFNEPVVPPTGDRGAFYASSYHPASQTATAAAVVHLQSGEEKTGVDIVLRPVRTRSVTGRLIGLPGPVTGLTVFLVAPDPSQRASQAALIDTPRAVADGSGAFAFLGIAPGAYTVFVQKPPTAADTRVLWASRSIVVGDADVMGLELPLASGARLSGRIQLQSAQSAALPADQLKAVTITARAVPGTPGAITSPRPVRMDRPDPAQFTTVEYIPGRYMVEIQGLPRGWVLASAMANGQNLVDQAFDLSASGLPDVVVTLTNQISTLTGIVRDTRGELAPAATVAVFPVDRSLWRIPGMGSRRVQTAAPGRDGRYTFTGLPAGDYLVAGCDWPSADFSDPGVLTALIPSAARVSIGDGTSHTQDLQATVRR
ncbi:MAG TPA: carboxypeptidase-like regulatory domain-containing protein [Vicinamibacterales bacterium]|nr:carboxypeptidase-like regulatory domain-containing protein [Vicinamibacterales bacterium]